MLYFMFVICEILYVKISCFDFWYLDVELVKKDLFKKPWKWDRQMCSSQTFYVLVLWGTCMSNRPILNVNGQPTCM